MKYKKTVALYHCENECMKGAKIANKQKQNMTQKYRNIKITTKSVVD